MATGSNGVHPAANVFAMMSDAELRALADDIKANGQREPVVYFRGKLLDGRNRAKACALAGVEVDSCEIDDDQTFDPLAYVISVNLHRRHLDESQRGMAAGRLKKLMEPAAKEKRTRKPQNSVQANLPEQNTREQAAALLNVGSRTVNHAATVLEYGSTELIAAVDRGDVAVSKAATIAKSTPKNEQISAAKTKPPKKPTPTPLDRLKEWWGKASDDQKHLFRLYINP